MTGFLKYFKDPADTPSYTRVMIGFENGYQLAYDCKRKLGEVNLSDSIEAFIHQRKLGPDALDPRFDLSAFSTILSRTRRPVKSALMNQRVIAGIGNVYSDEILFHAGIHPGSRSDRLPDKAVGRLFRVMRTSLKNSVKYRADPKRFPNSYLLPHRERGEQCPRCRRALAQLAVSAAATLVQLQSQRKGQFVTA